ncbi:hypothetical protein BDR26DRAFT_879856 [Obelidium mucronatum]|nr:hypothetical protein BDR26DRAFT_879856 [Obelidium mucronatum]
MSSNASPESSNESLQSNSSSGSNSGRFTKMVSELGKKLSRRQEKDALVGKNILKEDAVSPTIMANKLALEKERQQDALNRKLQLRPDKVDLKLRNILKSTGSNDSLNKSNEDLDKSLSSFEHKATKLRSCLKRRGGLSPTIIETQKRLSRSMIEDSLENKLRNRPDPEELHSKNILFCETVEVHSTFRKSEYNRKPDGDVTFKHLTPQLKNEMEIHDDAKQNTCFHY